jgi:hypothetical protein
MSRGAPLREEWGAPLFLGNSRVTSFAPRDSRAGRLTELAQSPIIAKRLSAPPEAAPAL